MRFQRFVISAVCLLGFAGCGDANKLKIVPVAGVVMYKNEPVVDAEVVFFPEKGPAGIATTDDEGAFQITTNGQAGGTVGINKITVSSKQSDEVPPSDGRAIQFVRKSTLPKKYADQKTTDLQVGVPEEGRKDCRLELVD